MVITGLTRNQLGSNPPRVRISPSPPSKGNEKDIAQETPDFIGGFAVSTVKIFISDFVDVKKVFFPFCSEPNSHTTEYKPPRAWIRTNPCAFFIPTERRKTHAKANRLGRGQTNSHHLTPHRHLLDFCRKMR